MSSTSPPLLLPLSPPSPLPSSSSSSSSATVRVLQRYLPTSLSPTLIVLHSHAKSWLYFSLTTALLVLALSNSFTRLFKSIWSDVGNNWAVIWSFILSFGYSHAALYIVGSSLLHFFMYWTYSAVLAYYDLLSSPHIFSRYKIQPTKNVPVSKAKLIRAIRQVVINQFLVAVPTVALTYPVAVWRGVGIDTPLPTFERFCYDMAVFLLVEEVLFYYVHRLLHHPWLYGRVHKLHHEWTAPIAIATNYCTPLEHLLSNLIPALAGPLLCGSHLAVIWVWQAIATLTSVNTHSGYHLPFMPSPEAHDFHHLRFNVNYGVLGLLDWLHGTDRTFRESGQYEHHKTYFSLQQYEPGLEHLRKREAGAGSREGGKASAWKEEKRVEADEEEVKGERAFSLGLTRAPSEL